MPASARESRQKQFKNLGKHEEMRRRRAEGSIELRKQKKDDNIMKRRNVALEDEGLTDEGVDSTTSPTTKSQQMSLEECIHIINSNPTQDQLRYTIEAIRRMLSRSKTPPIDQVVKSGLIPTLVAALSVPDVATQFESAWALTNIVSGTSEQTAAVVGANVLPPLIRLLHSADHRIVDQAAWALGNIAGDCAHYRDLVIKAGLVDAVENVMRQEMSADLQKTLAWVFSNICRHKDPHPSIDVLKRVVPHIAILLHSADMNTRIDACWALSYVTDGTDDQIQLALDNGVLPRVIDLLRTNEAAFVAPALRTLGNVVTGTDHQTQAVVDSGVLDVLGHLMDSASPQGQKECCWMLSNIVAGTKGQIQAVVDAGLVRHVVQSLNKDNKTQFEASWAIANLCQGGSPQQVLTLPECGVLEPVCDLLNSKNPKMVLNLLDTLLSLLDAADKLGQLEAVTLIVEECGGLDKIEQLQQHESEQIYQKAINIIETYFGGEEEENKENYQPDGIEELEQAEVVPDVMATGNHFGVDLFQFEAS